MRAPRLLHESEVERCLNGEDVRTLLPKKTGIIAWGYDGTAGVRVDFSGQDAIDLFQYAEAHNTPVGGSKNEETKGICASPGEARGIARLVSSPEENYRVNNGEILVTHTTMTDFLPAMKRAAAIVTEVGGLTCHAAVVSREFGIPCIVGLKNVMNNITDGDMVEVDADAGVVRKIE